VNAWPKVRLDECCEIVGGSTPSTSVPSFWDGDIPWATPKDLSELDGSTISDTPRKLTPAGLEATSATILPPGSVLFSSRAPIGHVALNAVPMATNQGFKSFIPQPDSLYAPFLYWWLRGNRSYLQGLGNGATFKELSKASISRVEIPLPPLREQRRIADILDRADELRTKRRNALVQLQALTQSIFVDMFGSGVPPIMLERSAKPHARGWPSELLTDVARLATGHTPDRKRADYWDGDTPWISLTDIRRLDGRVAMCTNETVTQSGIDHSSSVLLPRGTVCFSRTASVGFVTVMGRDMATSQDFVNWVCGPRINPMFLMHAFIQSRTPLRALSSGSTHKTIYFPTVERFRALVPPIEVQSSFARRIECVDVMKDRYSKALEELDALFASLQHRAFRGEL
jgi:type I restriction enzyme, S subunit